MSNGDKKEWKMEIIGLDSDYTGKLKYAVVMQGNLYYFPVNPNNKEKFLNDFKVGGKFHKISGGRMPVLIDDSYKTTKKSLDEALSSGSAPAISSRDYIKNEIEVAKQNNNAIAVDSLHNELLRINDVGNIITNKYNPDKGLGELPAGEVDMKNKTNKESLEFYGEFYMSDGDGGYTKHHKSHIVSPNLSLAPSGTKYALKKDKDGEVSQFIPNPGDFYMKSMK